MKKNEWLAHSILIDGQGGAEAIAWNDIRDRQPEHGILWVHLNFEHPDVEQWLREDSGLNDIASSALLSQESRPRTVTQGDNLLLAMRGVNLNPGEVPEDMVSIRIWTDGKRVISTFRRNLLAVDDVLAQFEDANGPTSVADWLVSLNDSLVRRMSDTIENLEDKLLSLEERILSGDLDGLRYQLAYLRKQALGIRRFLAPQREALNRLVSERLSWMDELNLLRLREVNDRLIRYIEDLDEMRERASIAQDEMLSTISEQMNERSYVLTIVAALFLPLGFFTGLMGINVGGMPGIEEEAAFWIVTGLCLVIVAMLGVVFRLKKWL